MDDLQQVVTANLEGRRQEADKAEAIIAEEIIQFYKWVATLEVTPTIVALRRQFDELRRAELERTLAGWKDAPQDTEKRLEALTSAFMNKLLHHPTAVLKKAGQGNRTDLYLDALRALFELELDTEGGDESLELEE
jgi:glutamyl-tRNA reductase